jgi:hypothetical protein
LKKSNSGRLSIFGWVGSDDHLFVS